MIEKFKKLIIKYETFIKYIIVAIVSFIIDIAFFNIFNGMLSIKIFYATILARIISSFINYLLNKNRVFKSEESGYKSLIRYYTLVVVQMLVSAFIVDNLYDVLTINATLIKVPVEMILFLINYTVQKLLIFKRGNHENNQK